jgi:uncharacterized membrane protein YoaK (UPF0700 family)
MGQAAGDTGLSTGLRCHHPDGRQRAFSAVPWLEKALLAGLFITLLLGAPLRGPDTPAGLCASVCGLAAMGVRSALVRLILSGPSRNVMTTNTTQLAIEVTEQALASRARRVQPADPAIATELAWARAELNALWLVVLGFLAGAITGAFAAGLALWARVGQTRRPASYLGARAGSEALPIQPSR